MQQAATLPRPVQRIRLLGAVILVAASLSCKDRSSSAPENRDAGKTVNSVPAEGGMDRGGITDTEIILAQPAGFTGQYPGIAVEMWRGAMAAFSAANDAGGVHGRKIRLVLADDGYDPEKAAGTVVKLVEDHHPFALFGAMGVIGLVRAVPAVRTYYLDDGLFYFWVLTGADILQEPKTKEIIFNPRATYEDETRAVVDAFVSAGRKKFGLFGQTPSYVTPTYLKGCFARKSSKRPWFGSTRARVSGKRARWPTRARFAPRASTSS